MIEKEFIPYQQALALKELGFDKPCFATIDQTESVHIKGTEHTMGGTMFYFTIDAPTYSQAFRWFRDKHNLMFQIFYLRNGNHAVLIHKTTPEYMELVDQIKPSSGCLDEIVDCYSYDEAELACLRKLISIVKQQQTTSHTEPETTDKEFLESADKTITVERQETLEEAAERYDTLDLNADLHFIAGAKWQQKRMYSEEDVLDILRKSHSIEKTSKMDSWITKWFEQHKKK